jgi:hypothetical protein
MGDGVDAPFAFFDFGGVCFLVLAMKPIASARESKMGPALYG